MAVGNIGQNNRRSDQEQYNWKTNETRNNASPSADQKQSARCGRASVEGNLKSCPVIGSCKNCNKSCKNCNKSDHFAKMCRSQQINEVTEAEQVQTKKVK